MVARGLVPCAGRDEMHEHEAWHDAAAWAWRLGLGPAHLCRSSHARTPEAHSTEAGSYSLSTRAQRAGRPDVRGPQRCVRGPPPPLFSLLDLLGGHRGGRRGRAGAARHLGRPLVERHVVVVVVVVVRRVRRARGKRRSCRGRRGRCRGITRGSSRGTTTPRSTRRRSRSRSRSRSRRYGPRLRLRQRLRQCLRRRLRRGLRRGRTLLRQPLWRVRVLGEV